VFSVAKLEPKTSLKLREVRAFTADDAEAVAVLYRDSVRDLGKQAYGASHLAAWSKYADDVNEFRTRVLRGVSLVSLEGGELAAVGQLHPTDCIALLYCAPRFARRGHATTLCLRLEEVTRARGVSRLWTTASKLSRPLFEKQGFRLFETERSVFNGAEFERYKMEKLLG
jgi:putative acetyltransferase